LAKIPSSPGKICKNLGKMCVNLGKIAVCSFDFAKMASKIKVKLGEIWEVWVKFGRNGG